jgi:hypothetical protein
VAQMKGVQIYISSNTIIFTSIKHPNTLWESMKPSQKQAISWEELKRRILNIIKITDNYQFEFIKQTETISNKKIQYPQISFKNISMKSKKNIIQKKTQNNNNSNCNDDDNDDEILILIIRF